MSLYIFKNKIVFSIVLVLLSYINLFSKNIFVAPDFPAIEVIRYRTFNKNKNIGTNILEKRLIRTNINNKSYYKIYTESSEGFNRIELLDDNLITIKFLQIRNKKVERKFVKKRNKIHLIVPEDYIDKFIEEDYPVYDAKSIQYVFRGYPWNKKYVKFYAMLNNGRVVKLYAENLGITKIKIPAGEFKAYKILLEPSSSIAKLVYRTKMYFYFSIIPPYPYLKYEDTDGGVDEVINIKVIKKGGKK